MKLRGKLLLPLLCLGTLLAAAGGFIARRTSRAALEEWMIDRARLIAASIASATEAATPEAAFQRIVDSLGRFEGVSEIVVIGGSPPRVLATNVPQWVGVTLDRLPESLVADDLLGVLQTGEDSYDLQHADGTLVDYTAHLAPFAVGSDPTPHPAAVMIHLSSRSLRVESALAARRSIAWAAAGISAMTAAALAIVAFFVLRPTSAIVKTLQARSAGAKNARAGLDSNDEIGDVAAALNTMLDTIDREESLRREVEAQNRRLLEQLRDERDRAQAGERAKSEFLATMSHEIRTPMNGILGFADLLRATRLAPDQQDYVDSLWRSGRALLTLLDDILDFSKIEAGRMTMDAVPFDLAEIVGDVAALFFDASAKKGVDLVLDIDADVPTRFVGDPHRVRQILSNLVGNAVKFTDTGSIRIAVLADGSSTTHAKKPRIEVKDTGLGIPEDARSRLFQRFQQVDLSTTRRFGGTGLGLAICRRLVQEMGGEIGYESRLGAGSTFWFTLSLPSDSAAPASPTRRIGESSRVLLATRRTAIGEVLLRSFHSRGADAIRVDDVDAAITRLENGDEKFDILFVDLRPYLIDEPGTEEGDDPKRNSRERRLDHLLRLCRDREIRTIAIVRPQDRRDRRAVGFDASLTEPVVRSESLERAFLHDPSKHEPRNDELRPGHPTAVLPNLRCRVLVAEDNPVNQKLVRLMLENLGCEVDLAADGEEAVDLATRETYDLILMDCQMPGLDGYEAARRIRSAETGSIRIPIVALTANVLAEDRNRCFQAGMDDHIAKPFRLDDLRAMLGRYADSSSKAKRDEGPADD